LKFLKITFLSLFVSTAFATSNDIIEYTDITNKKAIFKFLFVKHPILLNQDCHRRVFEGRAAKVYVAMGCKITRLELDKSQASETMAAVKATYNCDGELYPYTAHCELK
jgi:hypothetical protein